MGKTGQTTTTAHTVSSSSSRKSKSTLSTQDSTTTVSESQLALSDAVSVNSDQEYPIKCILEESSDKYLIAWEGPYEPTWEPKEFANDVAIQIWENKKSRTQGTANKFGDSSQQSSLVPVSSTTSAGPHSTVPESQQALFSQSTAFSIFTDSQSLSNQSQASVLSGSLYCPDSSDQPTQSTGGVSTQSQHQILTRNAVQIGSTGPIENSSLSTQSRQATTSGSGESSNHCSVQFVRPNTRSELLDRLRRPAPQYRFSGSTNSTSANFSINPSQATSYSKSSGSARLQRIQGRHTGIQTYSSIGYANSTSGNSETTLEIAETPEARLSLQDSQSSSRSRPTLGHSTLSRTPVCYSSSQVSPLDESPVYQTPIRRVTNPSRRVATVPESVQRDISSQPSSSEANKLVRPLTSNYDTIHVSTPSQSLADNSSRQAPDIPPTPSINMNETSTPSGSPNPPMSMEEARRNNPGTSFREKMRFIRAHERSLIREPQTVSASATPSSAGDIEPSQPAPARDGASPLTVRMDKEPTTHPAHVAPATESAPAFIAPQALHYTMENPVETAELLAEALPNLAGDAELPDVSAEPTDEHVAESEPTIEEAPEPQPAGIQLGPMEFAVPLSMDSRVKDDYYITLSAESKTIGKFLEESSSLGTNMSSSSSEYDTIVSKIRRMIEKLDNITTHPDLNDQPAPTGANPVKEAAWAEYSSSKFQFLGYFIDAASSDDLHIIIVVRTDKAVKVVENYLVGKEFTSTQTNEDTSSHVEVPLCKGPVSFAVRTANEYRITQPDKIPSAIIALDNSFDAENPAIRQIRTQHASNGNILPVIRLLVSNTAEHIERCLPETSGINKLRLLVRYTRDLSDTAGELQDDALDVQENAEKVVSYLKADPSIRAWPLAAVELVPVEMPERTPPVSEAEQLRSMSSSRQKRLLDNEDEDANQSKRQRMTPFQDITHISGSMVDQTQTQGEGNSHLSERSLVQAKNAMEFEVRQVQEALENTKARLQSTETSLSKLQHRYETRLNNYHKLRKDLDQALETNQKSSERLERQKIEIMKLKDEKAALAKDLEEARNTIKEGGGTDAELEKAREEVRRLTKENASLQRTVQQERSQSEYTRTQYQNASTSAAQTAMELRQVEEELGELKTKAASDLTKLKQIRQKSDEQRHLARIEELETTLVARDEMLNRKEEELRELKKNRPSTRATSLQPRSPKWGASRPASPGPNNVGGAGAGGNHRGSALRFPC
ncbi:hypothetical protein AJ79_09527 [Helicocarpus griseus UAMH5409]|uniref:Chromo domain-containing protein n=1 Tax=Helicocarpus griseus UAMH5409 TaxID=1447875 RepID=A0A2B7WJ62_9EURO|nr:hypothetical protein AJ79_09527 [Helicocarpus griseus UAMH5409]